MSGGGGYLLVCGFLCSNAGIPLPLKVHMHQSPARLCAHNVKAPQRCVQLQRDDRDMLTLKGLCWLKNDCNRISLNLHSALLIVWGFVSLLMSFCLSVFFLFFERLLAWSCLNMTHILNGDGELYLFNSFFFLALILGVLPMHWLIQADTLLKTNNMRAFL